MMCPLCGNRSFVDHRGRIAVQCTVCGSLERHRLFALFLIGRYRAMENRPIHILPRSTLMKLQRLFGKAITATPPLKLREQADIGTVLLSKEFDALGMPIADFFAQMRDRKSVV